MKSPFPTWCLLAILLTMAGTAVAEKADRNKPMNIEADSLRYDDLKQVSLFSGRVLLTKGSIVIRGAQLEARQDPDGFQFGTVTGTPGSPAFFRQKRDGVDEFIEGEAELIQYDGRADTVTFTGKAQLRRLRGTALGDEISGAVIVYENLTDKFTVDGAARDSGNAAAGSGRVRAMLIPKSQAEGGGAAPVPSPGASGLRPSLSLPGASR